MGHSILLVRLWAPALSPTHSKLRRALTSALHYQIVRMRKNLAVYTRYLPPREFIYKERKKEAVESSQYRSQPISSSALFGKLLHTGSSGRALDFPGAPSGSCPRHTRSKLRRARKRGSPPRRVRHLRFAPVPELPSMAALAPGIHAL